MKVALLSSANSIHTVRWANGLAQRGVDVHLISAHAAVGGLDARVVLHRLPFNAPLGYIAGARALRRLLTRIAPDIVNAHYATGYGLLARLSGFQPLLLSVWGSDVHDFPTKSRFHRLLLRRNLRYATALASTSHCMARQAARIFPHPHVFITPFGVDETVFDTGLRSDVSVPGAMAPSDGTPSTDAPIVVGTVKTLSAKYGIDTLIFAFALAVRRLPASVLLRLEITGDGPDRAALEKQAEALGIADKVTFHGAVAHGRVSEMLNRLDIYAALSRLNSESFGVAAIEASACELPVVVSDAEGLAEVTLQAETGFVVPKNDPAAASEALLQLIRDAALRRRLGAAGREHVLKHYTWSRSLDLMLVAYQGTIAIHQKGGTR